DGEVYGRAIVAQPGGGLVVTGWGDGLSAEYQQGFVLALDSAHEPSCVGLFDVDLQPELAGAPLLLNAAPDANRVYVGGLTFSGQFRALVSAWDLP
ncbi:MAG TPA: hypothetical protein VM869_35545, partial [Enhygromyxa sp.]|nr:hypothetical protein [Enhygromyxa sp.]